ncbi:CPBP family intramembrane metalloprotease [Hoyosella sp. G463]|uniref:CPBP family intramembrane metalloprotease n=1 Tax=Lolliginicoccus lacisalsi TaxID=2742202 RepID=A0A927JBS3_9ACTN|nr:type II CAAX endopeptidase family protein [Lolliginicoccus lacisalsi]MBD8505512.1 CPBP family intramembrane metalloprotease [Lolliginicoccus lacisalsi]
MSEPGEGDIGGDIGGENPRDEGPRNEGPRNEGGPGNGSRDAPGPRPIPKDWWYPTSIDRPAQSAHGSADPQELWQRQPIQPRPLGAPRPAVPTGQPGRWKRAEESRARRMPGQRWGMGAAILVLAANLAGFAVAALIVDPASPLLVIAVIVPTLLAALLGIGITWARGNGPWIDLGLPRSLREAGAQAGVGLVLGAAAVLGGLLLALALFGLSDDIPTGPLQELADQTLGWRIALAMWIWIGAPIVEEVIFRGIVWGALEKQRNATRWRWLAHAASGNISILVLTAVLFAAWHAEPWRLGILLFAGLVFGVARLYTGGVLAPMVAHSVNNTLPALSVLFLPVIMP